MNRYLCHLCKRIVTFGDIHTCFDGFNNNYVYPLPQFEESQKVDTLQDCANNKFTENWRENSANLNPEVTCRPASPKIQVSSFLNISNEKCDTTLEESKLKSLNYDKDMFMNFLDIVAEQVHSDNKIISQTSSLNASSDLPYVNKVPYSNMIQEYRYERNSSEEVSEAEDKIEEMATYKNESMHSNKNEDALSRPSRMRGSEKCFPGKLCSKKFSRKSNLKNMNKELMEDENAVAGPSGIGTHKKTFHFQMHPENLSSKMADHYDTRTSDNLFVCDVCEKQFSRNGHLVKHCRTHTGEKPFECDTCKKAFSDKSNLKRHIRTHTREKPYKCSVCEMTFANSSSRYTHQRRMHKHIAEK